VTTRERESDPSAPRITEIRQRLEQATKGPWRAMSAGNCVMENGRGAAIAEVEGLPRPWNPVWVGWEVAKNYFKTFLRQEDAEFIAHAREDVPYLLDALAASQSQVEQLQQIIRDHESGVENLHRVIVRMEQELTEAQQARDERDHRIAAEITGVTCSPPDYLLSGVIALRERAESAEQQLTQLRAQQEPMKAELNSADYDRHELRDDIREIIAIRDQYAAMYEQVHGDRLRMVGEVATLRAAITQFSAQRDQLQALADAYRKQGGEQVTYIPAMNHTAHAVQVAANAVFAAVAADLDQLLAAPPVPQDQTP
jgi:DNA repair exonuclease SbcCD ATPase subunit